MLKSLLLISALFALCAVAAKEIPRENQALFDSAVPRMQIEISAEGMKVLRDYVQIWRQPRPERIDVKATVREGGKIYTNVAVHLKGSFSFTPVDAKPSLTLSFDKFAPGQRFHGVTKIHLNNSVQDPSYLCEQLARDLFVNAGVPTPRAGHAVVKLNDRDLGLYVVIEGANKQFVKRNFSSAEGNLYDGGSGGDITKALNVHCGEHPEDGNDRTNLIKAAREPDLARRLARLERVLDVDEFISFAAIEALLVHWDGYSIGCNNYRLFHDVSRDKMVFIPHGMDQLFGTSSSPSLSITPPFKGMVAKQLFAVPEARQRYVARIQNFSTNEFRAEKLHAHVDRLATQLRAELRDRRDLVDEINQSVRALKSRITLRMESVAQQLANPKRPPPIEPDNSVRLPGWSFKGGPTQAASSSRSFVNGRQILGVIGRAPGSSGAWRTMVFLGEGHYEFTGRARTQGLSAADAKGTNGVILRVSGERETKGITISDEWTTLRYEFDVRGVQDEELVCEFRGAAPGTGSFEAASLRLVRKGPPAAAVTADR